MKRPSFDRIGDFMAGKGFYIVLLLCVAALGVTGWFLFARPLPAEDRAVSGPITVIVTSRPAAKATEPPEPPATASPIPVPAKQAAAVTAPTPAPAPTEKPTATASVFSWPVKGQVIRSWSVETLAWDETMGDWRTHDGVDLAAEQGRAVTAPAGGTISDIRSDDMLGTVVTILHAGGVMSTCANLDAQVMVEIGDTVHTGDVIGAVGSGAISESAQPSHIHLSMTKDGVSVDPLSYLPRQR